MAALLLLVLSLALLPAAGTLGNGPAALPVEAQLGALGGEGLGIPLGHNLGEDPDHAGSVVQASPVSHCPATPDSRLMIDTHCAENALVKGPRRPPRLLLS